MNTENKYFTPDISDIRVGYECEEALLRLKSPQPSNEVYIEGWTKYVLTEKEARYCSHDCDNGFDTFMEKVENNLIRVPYLTKEQIENEGWKQSKDYLFEKHIRDNLVYLLWFHEAPSLRKIIEYKYIGCGEVEEEGIFYKGSMKSVNELRYISKLLGI